MMTTTERREAVLRTTCPRDCYDACGMLVSTRDGAVRAVRGDPDHPVARGALCGKCALAYNGVWRDPERRLGRPLRRVGRKGEGRFATATWDEALADIAARLNAIRAADPARILHTHYTGTVGLLAGWFGLRLFNAIGATEIDPDTVCNKAGHVALGWTLGDSLAGFDPRAAEGTGCILVWGANPSATAPHMHRDWLFAARAPVIVIDPIRHETAARATIHLQLRPGSDAALAFGLMHVAEREGLLDRAFIDAHVLGWDLIAAEVAAATPARTAAACGLWEDDILHAARLYAAGPSLMWLGQGLQRQPRGGNVFRAAAALAAVTGNLGLPNAGLCYMNGPGTRGVDLADLTCPHLAPPAAPAPVSHLDLAALLADPARSGALLCWNNNIAASSPQQNAVHAALAREDLFHVCLELFETDTTAYADWVLPAASFLEFDDLVLPYFRHDVSAQVKAAEPMGEALPNQEIFRRLATAMGLSAPELFEADAPILDRLVAATGAAPDFATLARAGTLEAHRTIYVPFAGRRFPTPSGKVEIASETALAAGAPLVPECHADQPPPGEALRLLSPASPWTMNSSYANDPRIQAKLGAPTLRLHPEEAARRGIAAGGTARLRSAVGALTVVVEADPAMLPGVAVLPKGRWPLHAGADRRNVNALYDGRHGDVAESTAVHGVEAWLEPLGIAAGG